MKKLVLILTFVCVLAGLSAQVGLLGLYYGENFSTARSNLSNVGFVLTKNWPVTKVMGLENPSTYYMVEMYVNPSTSKLVGWSIFYDENLSDEENQRILSDCIDLHGDKFTVDEENNMIMWNLDSTKSLCLGCDEAGNLKVAVYYDDANQSIFDRADERP